MNFNGSLIDSINVLLILHVLWTLTALQILPKSYSKQKPDQKRNYKNNLRSQTVIRPNKQHKQFVMFLMYTNNVPKQKLKLPQCKHKHFPCYIKYRDKTHS